MFQSILLVEDDVYCQALLRCILSNMGFRVYCATNALEALRILSRSEVQAIITDYNLDSVETGSWLIERVVDDLGLVSVPIFVYSSSVGQDVPLRLNVSVVSKLLVNADELAHIVQDDLSLATSGLREPVRKLQQSF